MAASLLRRPRLRGHRVQKPRPVSVCRMLWALRQWRRHGLDMGQVRQFRDAATSQSLVGWLHEPIVDLHLDCRLSRTRKWALFGALFHGAICTTKLCAWRLPVPDIVGTACDLAGLVPMFVRRWLVPWMLCIGAGCRPASRDRCGCAHSVFFVWDVVAASRLLPAVRWFESATMEQ